MEGMLWKWTNYFSGWQPRWFVLEDGILSYYRSQDDINSSCKGSIKVSACDVSVHPTDLTRLDLIVPGEAHFYVKAANQHERQQWLIALGTTKACFGSSCSVPSETTADEFQTETLGSKKSELRLYCDLLMQQVYNVKMAVQDREHPNVELLNESTALLGATCDTFIKTLDDCVHLAHANQDTESFGDQSPSYKDVSSPTHSRLSISISKAIPWNVGAVQRQTSTERFISPGSKSPGSKAHSKSKRSLTRMISETSDQNNLSSKSNSRSPNLVRSPSAASSKDAEQNGIQTDGTDDLVEVDDDLAAVNHSTDVDSLEVRLPTFFTALPVSFLDIRLTADLQIPTVQFLDACRSFLQIFDKLNQTALVPGKLDLAGNVKKIHQKYVSSPETFDTLQKMMISEMQCGQCHVLNSATIAILWLNRSLQFIQHVMLEILSDSDDVVLAANNAYKKTLMNYHGWVVRSAFSIAISSSPSKEDLMKCLSLDDTQSSHPAFAKSLKHDAQDLASALATLTHLLHNFFLQNKLDFPDQI